MKTYKNKIGKYMVEVETEIDSDPSRECWIECGSYSGSFEWVGQTGILTSNDGEKQMLVSQSDFDAIEKWAESVGY